MAPKIHEVLSAKTLDFRELPMWMQTFLGRVKEHPYTTKPMALIVHKDASHERHPHDEIIVMRVVDLLQLLETKEHPMQTGTPHAMQRQD